MRLSFIAAIFIMPKIDKLKYGSHFLLTIQVYLNMVVLHYVLLYTLIFEDELYVLNIINMKYCLCHIPLYVYVNGQRHYYADFANKT